MKEPLITVWIWIYVVLSSDHEGNNADSPEKKISKVKDLLGSIGKDSQLPGPISH